MIQNKTQTESWKKDSGGSRTPGDLERSWFRRLAALAPYFEGVSRYIWVAVFASAMSALTEPMLPALTKPLLDNGFQGNSIPLWLVPLSLLSLFAVRGAASFVAQYALARAVNQAAVNLRRRLFGHLMQSDLALYRSHSASTMSSIVVFEVQNGSQLLVNAFLQAVRDGLTVVALLGYLLFLNWQLTLVVLAIFPLVALVMKLFTRRLHKITLSTQTATDNLAYAVEENVLAHRMVRLHGAQAQQAGRFDGLSVRLSSLSIKSVIAGSAVTPITQMLAAVALSIVISLALWQSGSSQITVGGFASFVMAMLLLIAPIKHLSEAASPITRGLAAIERATAVIERSAVEQGGNFRTARATGLLALQGVSVTYPGSAGPSLDQVTLTVKPGSTVALVGPSGSGKTTLANLLPRFLDPDAGQISLDGHPLSDWDLKSLRAQFALVSQDVVMFNDTVAANVALGEAPDEARVQAALQAANLAEHVASLPQGMHTVVGHNAVQLSGGQRQRLAIARALYKDAPFLVLDEATSALDNESERAVQDALAHLMTGRTSLVIAHRMSTIQHADQIVVMVGGRIEAVGTHEELLGQAGTYARLYYLASGGVSNELFGETTALTPDL